MNHILDISRLVSRAHLPFDTGIDRVERAFILDHLERFESPYFLAKVGKKYALIDDGGMREFLRKESESDWGTATGLDRFRLKLAKPQRAIRTSLRSVSVSSFSLERLPEVFEAVGMTVFNYTNVGHTNLGAGFLSKLRFAGCENMAGFVHDLIPLDYPELCREDTISRFSENMKNIARNFDWIYCNSDYTVDRVRHHFKTFGAVPKIWRGYLASPSIASKPREEKTNSRDNFVMLGTIEPRKNLSFILDVWDGLAKKLDPMTMPRLFIVGKRGWETPSVFSRLDHSVKSGSVTEYNNLNDDEVSRLLENSTALLFPSIVEGYGLPAQEALVLGVPVLASDIPVFKELFADRATLLPLAAPEVWVNRIEKHVKGEARIENVVLSGEIIDKTVTWGDFFDSLYTKINDEYLF